MTAFLFIPARTGAGVTRRVDLGNFASLFAEIEEPMPAGRGLLVARLMAMLLVALLVVGDTVLLTRPEALTRAPGCAAATSAPVRSL